MNQPNIVTQAEPITIVGIELRTTNEKAFETIPLFWTKFYQEQTLARIPNKQSDDVFAVYTNFEHEGKDNEGVYSMIIGAQVTGVDILPEGLVSTVIPCSKRAVFAVEGGPEKVGEAWMETWKMTDLKKTFIADYEHYPSSGNIEIRVGIE